MEGWIKLHRELLNKPIWLKSTPEQKTILITLLLMANHTQNKWEFRGQPYTCNAGQLITSIESIVKNSGAGITIRKVRTALKRFEKYEFLTNESTNRNRLITICNYDTYQSKKEADDKPNDKLLTGQRQASDKLMTTNNNDKKEKNVNNEENVKNETSKKAGEVVDKFNSICSNFPKVLTVTKDRSLKIKARLAEMQNDPGIIEQLFYKMQESNFLNGQNDKNWKATFDWVFSNGTNWLKVIEGNYDNREPITKPQKESTIEHNTRVSTDLIMKLRNNNESLKSDY